MRVFWYISKTKVENYTGGGQHWTDRLGGHITVGIPLVEVGVAATGPPDRDLVGKLEQLEHRADHDGDVLPVGEIGSEPPLLFRYTGKTAHIVVDETFWCRRRRLVGGAADRFGRERDRGHTCRREQDQFLREPDVGG